MQVAISPNLQIFNSIFLVTREVHSALCDWLPKNELQWKYHNLYEKFRDFQLEVLRVVK